MIGLGNPLTEGQCGETNGVILSVGNLERFLPDDPVTGR